MRGPGAGRCVFGGNLVQDRPLTGGMLKETTVSTKIATVRLLAALALLAPVTACSVFQGRQDVAEYAEDSVITNTIRARLVDDPVVNFGDVSVTTMNGVVTLSGVVDSSTEAARASQIARGVDGVKAVNNNIAVRRR